MTASASKQDRSIDWDIERGVSGIFVVGGSSEYFMLTDDYRRQALSGRSLAQLLEPRVRPVTASDEGDRSGSGHRDSLWGFGA